MAKNYKIAGQVAPAANTDTDLYLVPASTKFIASVLRVSNRGTVGVTTLFRVAVVPSGDTLANKHYIEYDVPIDGKAGKNILAGLALAPGDKIVVRADTTDLSFTLSGVELT